MIEELSKKTTLSWIELHQMDAEQLVFPDHSFDVVFCAFALFFFSDLDKALAELRRVLKIQGRLALSVFGKKTGLDQWVSEKVIQYGITSKLSLASLDNTTALRKCLEGAGFTRIEIQEESKIFWHNSAEEWWDSLWTHGIRFRLEQLQPQDLASLKKEALLKAGSGKVSEERSVFYAIARS